MIGIFGGTFDPIHYGHLRPASEVRHSLDLDALYLVPAANPPHRVSPIATPAQRMAMLELAMTEFPDLKADDRELQRGGLSYTVDTLQSFRSDYPQTALVLLMGTDAFEGIESWHQWQRLPELAHLIVMQRPGWEPESSRDWVAERIASSASELATQLAGRILFYPVTPQAISATGIREALAAGGQVSGMLPQPVLDYINQNHIYR
ncbi:MAG: nicotinate-nucleotide adenylyltransferase [Acidiferrobacterales bacterium]|nr:nicotinate-nucleotide adenylyltransferase [Acidiferrobacterales bacterium]